MKHTYWYLGFFALFAFNAVPGLVQGEWAQGVWLVWLVWLIFFFINDNTKDGVDRPSPDAEGAVDDSPDQQLHQ